MEPTSRSSMTIVSQQLRSLRAQLLRKTHQAETANALSAVQGRKIEDLQSLTQQLKAKIVAVEEERDSYAEQAADKAEENEDLEAQVAYLEERYSLATDGDDKYAEIVEEKNVIESEKNELEEERNELREDRNEKVQKIKELKAAAHDLAVQNWVLQDEIEELEARHNDLEIESQIWDLGHGQSAMWQTKMVKDRYRITGIPAIGDTMTWLGDGTSKNTMIVRDEDDMRCTICREDYEKDNVLGKLACGHYFHQECIQMWMNDTLDRMSCPRCRREFSLKMVLPQSGDGVVNVVHQGDLEMGGS